MNIEKYLYDADVRYRRAILTHPDITNEHLAVALTDQDITVRLVAATHPLINEFLMEIALDDPNLEVVKRATACHPPVDGYWRDVLFNNRHILSNILVMENFKGEFNYAAI